MLAQIDIPIEVRQALWRLLTSGEWTSDHTIIHDWVASQVHETTEAQPSGNPGELTTVLLSDARLKLLLETADLTARAMQRWGAEAQVQLAVEECAELILALNHHSRERASAEDVRREIADVLIMAVQPG